MPIRKMREEPKSWSCLRRQQCILAGGPSRPQSGSVSRQRHPVVIWKKDKAKYTSIAITSATLSVMRGPRVRRQSNCRMLSVPCWVPPYIRSHQFFLRSAETPGSASRNLWLMLRLGLYDRAIWVLIPVRSEITLNGSCVRWPNFGSDISIFAAILSNQADAAGSSKLTLLCLKLYKSEW